MADQQTQPPQAPTTTTATEPTTTTQPQTDTLLTAGGDTAPGEPATTPQPAADSAPPTSEPSWRDSLPEDIRGHERLTGFKSVDELAKAYAEASLAPAVPEASAYKVPENFPIKDIGDWASKAKLTQEQLDSIFELDKQLTTLSSQNLAKAYDEGLKQLFTAWGDKKDENLSAAKQVIKTFDTDGSLSKLLNETKAGNHPTVVNFFAQLGKKLLSEDGFIPNAQLRGGSREVSAAEVIFDVSGV